MRPRTCRTPALQVGFGRTFWMQGGSRPGCGGRLRTGASRAASGGEDSIARAARAAATIASFSRYR
jgi:hypothetical protein